jgi:hypothetical protein
LKAALAAGVALAEVPFLAAVLAVDAAAVFEVVIVYSPVFDK